MDLIIFLIFVAAVLLWMAWKQWGHLTKINPLATIKDWWAKRKVSQALSKILDRHEQTAPTFAVDLTSGPVIIASKTIWRADQSIQGAPMTNAELFNESGIRLTQMDKLLAEATARNKDAAVQVPLSAAHKLVGENGKALADLYTAVMTTPIVIPPVVPVPVLPTSGYTLTPDEIRAGILWGPAFGDFGAKGSGEKFPSDEERARYVRESLHQGEPGIPNPAATQIDPRTLTEDDWQRYVRHPEVWGKVQAGLYTNQQINAHMNGGPAFNPNWDDANYKGVLR